MGSRHVRTEANYARPILNERDYQNAKALVAREMIHKHTTRVWARLEALMQEVAEYERRFLEGEEDDAARLVEYAYALALRDTETTQRRWSDSFDE
jgi:shikimate kinase